MKYSTILRNTRTYTVSALFALTLVASPNADAFRFPNLKKKLNQAVKTTQGAFDQAAAKAKAAADEAAAAAKAAADEAAAAAKAAEDEAAAATKAAEDAAAAAAKAAADAVAAAAKAAADEAEAAARVAADELAAAMAAAEEFAAASAAISEEEMARIALASQSTYYDFSGVLVDQYQYAVEELEAIYDDILEALFREAGRIAVAQEHRFLKKLRKNMMNLDSEGTEALNRIVRGVPYRITDRMRDDIQTLGAKLGLLAGEAETILPDNVRHSSFGVVVAISGAYVAGAEGSVSVMMNTDADDRSVAALGTLSGTLGASIGGAAMVGIVWAPGSIDAAAGSSVGFGVSGAAGAGAGAALSWNVSEGMSGAVNAIPSFTLSFDGGAKISAAFVAGQTLVLSVD